MSKLISGKEALVALANGEDVEYLDSSNTFKVLGWVNAMGLETNLFFGGDRYKFRIKPKTITLNGVEIPTPFKPKVGEDYWFINTSDIGYGLNDFESDEYDGRFMHIGAWRTEDEIKQVVEALRNVLKVD